MSKLANQLLHHVPMIRVRLSQFWKHPAFEWMLWLGIPTVLYLTGWHTEVIGSAQRLMLATGLINVQTTSTDSTPADFSLSLQGADGKVISLQELKGKVIFMNFWATWCPPCIAEMPSIQKLYEQSDPKNTAFVMISVDEDPEKVKKFIKRKKYTFPVYTLTAQGVPVQYASQSIPITFVISADGKVVLRHAGMANYNTEDFKKFLQPFLHP